MYRALQKGLIDQYVRNGRNTGQENQNPSPCNDVFLGSRSARGKSEL
jgi:hypothetical protein